MNFFRRTYAPAANPAATGDRALPEAGAPLCECVELDGADEQALLARLRAMGDAARAASTTPTVPKSARIRDIVLIGPPDDDSDHARRLKGKLDREFSEERLEFRVVSYAAPGTTLRAFFGFGVFAPGPDDVRVADVQFAWQENPAPEDIAWPKLGLADGRDDKAAWYAGQRGVALGFHPDWAPAVIDCRTAPVDDPAIAGLEDVLLFLGRRDPHTHPVVGAQVRGKLRVGSVDVLLDHGKDWWLRDGDWQRLIIRTPMGVTPLWFRITNCTGDIPFSAIDRDRRRRPPSEGQPHILVRGLVLPEPPSLLQLAGGLLSQTENRPSRWVVDFDERNRLRSTELADLFRSVVADRGPRLAVWRHNPPGTWADSSWSIDGRQNLELAWGERIELRNFPPSQPRDANKDRRRTIHQIYGRHWCLLTFEPEDSGLGTLSPGLGEIELADGPEIGRPVAEDEGMPLGDVYTLGLDWVNRTAHVVVRGRALGLGEYWSQLWKTMILADPLRLTITVSRSGTGVSHVYSLGAGERGPLGPLYIEYVDR